MSAEAARSVMNHARMEVMEGKGEMQKIKAALRSVAAGGYKTLNCLQLSAKTFTGLPESSMPRFKLKLSSPIEELELTKIWDPLNADAEGSTLRFEGVDSFVATLTVSSYDVDVPLGSGAGHDVVLLCKFDPMKPAGKAVTMINVAIVPDESMAPLDVVAEKKATIAVNSTLGNRSPLKESP